MKNILTTIFIVCIATSAYTQKILNEYIEIGLEKNLALQQKQVDYNIAIKALKEAKGLFFPEVSLNARYTVANGGRVIEFPIGDLLNPVYSSLNQLMSLPVENQFPLLENEEIPFLRKLEHDTKVSVVQPLYNARLNANYKLKKQQLKMAESQIRQYKNELTFEIKKAYFDYLKTLELIQLLENSTTLINKNLAVNQKLVANNLATKEVVLRAQTEVSNLSMKLNEASKNKLLAQSYLNFLINRDFDARVTIDSFLLSTALPSENIIRQTAYSHREELKQLNVGSNIYQQMAKMHSAENIPSLFLAADYGFQGEEYRFTEKDDYAMLTVGLQWTLFNGAINKVKHEQALLQKDQIELQKQEVRKMIELELRRGILDYNQQEQNLKLAHRQVEEANEVFRMVEKKYQIGTATQIEWLDAQNTKSRAEMNTILSQYELLNCYANLEKTIGTKFH